jgi:hypothetical protein
MVIFFIRLPIRKEENMIKTFTGGTILSLSKKLLM